MKQEEFDVLNLKLEGESEKDQKDLFWAFTALLDLPDNKRGPILNVIEEAQLAHYGDNVSSRRSAFQVVK